MEYKKLKYIAAYPTGKLNSNAAVEGGKYPFFTCAHEVYSINKYAYEGEYVLLGGNNASGDFPIFYYNGKFEAYQRTYLIQPLDTSNYDTHYLYYSIGLKLAKMRANASGTATKFLTKPILDNLYIEDWDIDYQKNIVSIMSSYDNLIEINNRRIKILEQMAENLYKEWFVRFRFPGHENAEFVDGVPKGWEVYRLDGICDINKCNLNKSDKIDKILYLDTGSLTENRISDLEEYFISDAPSRAKRKVKENSILFSTVRPALKHYGILRKVPRNMIVSTGFAVLDTKYDIANIIFMYLSSDVVLNYCQMIAEGAVATYPTIRPDEIGKIKILLPPIEQAVMWNEKLNDYFSMKEKLNEQNEKLIKQRDYLLPRLMSGKIQVE